MRYRIIHKTSYDYDHQVGLCQNEARLQPRDFWRQRVLNTHLQIEPPPSDYRERLDFFGNRVAYFAIQRAHEKFTVTSISEIDITPDQHEMDFTSLLSWEQVRNQLQQDLSQEVLDARQYVLDSPMITSSQELAEYAQLSFTPGRPLAQVVNDLMRRIYSDFKYDAEFSTIATPLSDVLAHKRGVCQDFAHLAIGCLRSFGIAARYISGYIETIPPENKERMIGADASHAWFGVYIPGSGWLEFDPTNNQVPQDQHITLAWGRDFSDVTPLKGIAFGGGQHKINVSVDVKRLD